MSSSAGTERCEQRSWVYVREGSRQAMRLHHKRSCWDRQIKIELSLKSILVSLCTHLDL